LSDVLTLTDLEAWSRESPSLAVLGHPIGHSLSPPMHNAALAALGREDSAWADWRYFRFDIPPEDLPRALALLHAKRFRGVNLTVPHKVLAFDQMAEVDDDARPVGAVNTLKWTTRGWHGFNTDGYGLSAALRATLGYELAGRPVVLIGAGGAARAAAIECLRRGCSMLAIFNRTRANLDVLLALLRPLAGNIPLHGLDLILPADLAKDSPNVYCSSATAYINDDAPAVPDGIVINSTSLGLRPDDPAPIELTWLPKAAGVYDMIYNPPQTALLRAAASLGVPHANGLSMLVHQGAKALEIWTGIPAARTAPVMQAAAEAAART
jgi:shikimate dehydrogenase